jgi:hypothetical protein
MGVEPERISKEGGGLVELIIRYLVRGTEEFQANYQTGKRMTQRKFEPSTSRTIFCSVTVARH